MHRYPLELNESIWSLMKAGCGASEVKQRIDAGDGSITLPKPIPLRTVQHKMAMLRRSRGEPEVDGQPVPELADAIASEFLNGARRQLRLIREATKDRCINPDEALALERLGRIVNELRKGPTYRDRDGTKRRVGRLPGQSTAPSPKSLLARLAKQAQEAREGEARFTPSESNGTA